MQTAKKPTKPKSRKPKPAKPGWVIGSNYFLRTVTHYLTGRLVAYDDHELWLADAAWVADTGRYMEAITTGALNEVEPYPDGVYIPVGRGALIDGCPWDHELPRKQQ